MNVNIIGGQMLKFVAEEPCVSTSDRSNVGFSKT